MTDEFTDTLRTMLDDPPEPAEQFDETGWTAGITRSIHRRRRTRRLAAGSLAAMAVAAGLLVPTLLDSAPRHGGDTIVATGQQLPVRTITGAIMKVAAASGDATPSTIRYVSGTGGDLAKHLTNGDKLNATDSAKPAVLVQATGTFAITKGELHCRKTAAGKQHCWTTETSSEVAYVVMDLHTGRVLDSGLNPNAIDLSSVGTVHKAAVPK